MNLGEMLEMLMDAVEELELTGRITRVELETTLSWLRGQCESADVFQSNRNPGEPGPSWLHR